MSETYRDRQDSPLYGSRLIIFRRKDQRNGIFVFRAKIEGVQGYIRRSTKTDNPQDAMRIAQEAYDELRIRKGQGFSLQKVTVQKFFDDWLEKRRHRFTEQRRAWKEACFYRYLVGYFGNKDISSLTKPFVDEYWSYRLNFWLSEEGKSRIEINERRTNAKSKSSRNIAQKPSYATLRAEASLINEILQAAVDQGYLSRPINISAMDAVPKEDRESGVRATFDDAEWRVVTRHLYDYAYCRGRFKDQRVHSLHRFQRRMLHAFVLLADYTGLRVGEQKQLVWRDLEPRIVEGKKALVIRVRRETSKVKKGRAVVARGDHIIKVMEEFKEITPRDGDEDLIFFSEKNGTITPADVSVSWKNFLKRVPYEDRAEGLRFSKDGKPRTLYSLRHHYCISRLKQGVDVFRLATNMGTGVDQIRKHYGSHISGDAFVKELTKYRSKGGEKAKASAVKQLVEMVESGVLDEEIALDAFRKVVETRLE